MDTFEVAVGERLFELAVEAEAERRLELRDQKPGSFCVIDTEVGSPARDIKPQLRPAEMAEMPERSVRAA